MRYFRIGLFVTLAGFITIYYMMATAESLRRGGTYTVYAYIDDASGLVMDSFVRLAGVEVGRVKGISLQDGRARLEIHLREGVRLPADSRLSKSSASMLGYSNVVIDPGDARGGFVQPGGVINNVEQRSGLNEILAAAGVLADEATAVIAGINRQMIEEGTILRINEVIEIIRDMALTTSTLLEQNLTIARTVMQNAASFSGTIDGATAEQLRVIEAILASVASMTDRLDRIVAQSDEPLARSLARVESELAQIGSVIEALRAGAENVSLITSDVATQVSTGQGNIGLLLKDDELYTRVVDITRKAEEFIDSTVGMDVQVGYRSEFMTQQRALRSTFDVRLTPPGGLGYYTVGVVSAPMGLQRTVQTQRTVTGTQIGGTAANEQTTTTELVRTSEVNVSLQLARIWGPLTVRGGLIAGSAGVGLDYQPIRHLELSSEIYGFGAQNRPYLRGWGTYYPFFDTTSNNPLRWIYLSGGIEDALGSYNRDFFFGAGLRFTDRNVRGLLGFVPRN